MHSEEARRKVGEWLEEKEVGERGVSYHLRDWLISRQRYWGTPIPIVYCPTCWARRSPAEKETAEEGVDYEMIEEEPHAIVPVPEEKLPVKLPYIEDFKPLGTDEAPLARSRDFYRAVCPECTTPAIRETDVADTFLDSSWYFLRYPSVRVSDDEPFEEFRTHHWLPVDMYVGGAEHAVLHLLYSRFVTHALHDMGHVPFAEPFTRFRAHGLLISEGAKMSKSKGNVINPDEYIAAYGADTVRTYLLFTGPFEQGGDFRDEGVIGVYRFLRRTWDMAMAFFEREESGSAQPGKRETYSDLDRSMHTTVKKVAEDIEALKFNTAVAQLMTYQNKLVEHFEEMEEHHFVTFLQCLAPFAPHLCEELYQRYKMQGRIEIPPFSSVSEELWPEYDEEAIRQEQVTIIVQVNGTPRDQFEIQRGVSEEEAVRTAKESEKIQRWLQDKEIQKTVFVPDKLINFVTGEEE